MDTKRTEDMIRLARELANKHNELVAQIERELTKEPVTHYNGEPCNLPVWELSDKKLPEGKRLVYTGEFREILEDALEWMEYQSKSEGKVAAFGWSRHPAWILREEPIECHNEELKPKPRKGTVCDAPRDKDVPTEGVFIFRDDEKQLPKKGDYALGECGCTNDMIFQAAYEFGPDNTRYILTHIMPKFKVGDEVIYSLSGYTFKIRNAQYYNHISMYGYSDCDNGDTYFHEIGLVLVTTKPKPEYKDGQWVIVDLEIWNKPRLIESIHYEDGTYFYKFAQDNCVISGCAENMVKRLAVPSDWAVEFNGVKVWMRKDKYGATWAHVEGKSVRNYVLQNYEETIYTAAGIKTVPKEVCDGHK